MMYADLIDQEDLLGQLKALGFQVPSGSTAEQACECAVRGLDNVRAFELRKMVEPEAAALAAQRRSSAHVDEMARALQIMTTETHKGFTKLTFKLDDVVMFAFYSDNGQLLAVTRNIVSSQLPFALRISLKNDYEGYWITELFEFSGDSDSAYYVSLENADKKVVLRSTGDGWEEYSSTKK